MPTIHVPVMQLKVTSSHFLDQAEKPTVTSPRRKRTLNRSMTSTVHTIVTVKSSSASSVVLPTTPIKTGVSSSDINPSESIGDCALERERERVQLPIRLTRALLLQRSLRRQSRGPKRQARHLEAPLERPTLRNSRRAMVKSKQRALSALVEFAEHCRFIGRSNWRPGICRSLCRC